MEKTDIEILDLDDDVKVSKVENIDSEKEEKARVYDEFVGRRDEEKRSSPRSKRRKFEG